MKYQGLFASALLAGVGIALAPASVPAQEGTAPAEQAAAPAEEAPVADGATLYKTRTCIACHGPDAKTPILPSYPKLAGQNADYAFQQMKDIKSGARNNGATAAMSGIMHLVTEAEMRVLADYVAGLEP
jgi:cytochrome c